MHGKRLPALRSEVAISVEANSYGYKLPPGYVSEVFPPLLREVSLGVVRLMEKENLLDDQTRARFESPLAKLEILLEGRHVGTHPARM